MARGSHLVFDRWMTPVRVARGQVLVEVCRFGIDLGLVGVA
jgi:hypothetical protein